MQTAYVDWKSFDPARLLKTALEQKTSKPKPDPNNPAAPPTQVTYYEIPLQYRYDAKDKDGNPCTVVAEPTIEGPELYSPCGIMKKPRPGGQGESASILTQFDMTNPDIVQFVSLGDKPGTKPGPMQQLYQVCYDNVWDDHMKCGEAMKTLKKKDFLEALFPNVVHWPRDTNTGMYIEGRSPSKFFPLLCYGKPGTFMRKETQFSVPLPHPTEKDKFRTIEWDKLSGVEMKFRPMITFKKVMIAAGKASIQVEIRSAVVTYIVRANTVSPQKATLSALQANTAMVSQLEQQMAELDAAFATSKATTAAGGGTTDGKAPPREEGKEGKEGKTAPAGAAPGAAAAATAAPSALPPPRTTQPAGLPVPSASPGLAAILGGGGLPGLPPRLGGQN